MLKRIDHPLVSHFFEMIEDDRHYYLVLEHAENGDLGAFLNERGALNEVMARNFFSEIITVISYLHNEAKIAHRNLKPENILLDRFNNIRIIDFGLSNEFLDCNETFHSPCGSPAYAAPEIILGKRYTRAADVWSLGVILYKMVTGTLPFTGDNVNIILQKITSGEPPKIVGVSASLKDLLEKMLRKSPNHRITLSGVASHPWVAGNVQHLERALRKMQDEMAIDQSVLRFAENAGFHPSALEIIEGTRTPAVSLCLQYMRSRMVVDLFRAVQSARTATSTPVNLASSSSLPRTPKVIPRKMHHKIPAIPTREATKTHKPTSEDSKAFMVMH